MSTVITSNKAYTGSKVLPHITDYLTSAADKTAYLQKLYASVNGDTSYITDANSATLLTKLNNHRNRVNTDGGIVLSLAMTLRALIFATKNSLTSTQFVATSPEFGVKMLGTTVLKVYDLNGRDQVPFLQPMTYATDNNLICLVAKGDAAAGLMQSLPITAGDSIISGSCTHDINPAGAYYTVSPRLFSNVDATTGIPNGTGQSHMAITEASTAASTKITLEYSSPTQEKVLVDFLATGDFKYAGTTGIVGAGVNPQLFRSGVLAATASTHATKPLSGIGMYASSVSYGTNCFINESWVIMSSDVELAKRLGQHLNKREFN